MAIAVEAIPAAAEAVEGTAGAAEGATGAAEGTAGAAGGSAGGQGGAVRKRISQASQQLRSAPAPSSGRVRQASTAAWDRLPSGSGSSPAAKTATKLIWAVAIGLIVLQIASEATGRYWSFQLPGLNGGTKPQPQPYQPLYAGQQISGAMPGVIPPTWTGPAVQPQSAPLSNRSAGNQGV